MKNITAYSIVNEFEGPDRLQEKVNELIRRGWQPLGGISITFMAMDEENELSQVLMQAMVQYAPD
jgi:hypothetical protein